MGVGGSTSRPSSSTTTLVMTKRPPTSSSSSPPSRSCCSHYRENHHHAASSAAVTRTVTPAAAPPTDTNSIDDEIEEIVANTLDLVAAGGGRTSGRSTSGRSRRGEVVVARDTAVPSSAASGVARTTTVRVVQRVQSGEDEQPHYEIKESIPEVDFAKFKKVNHQGATIQNNGRILHHQESDLLWRLGLISPEAYKHAGTREHEDNPRPQRSRSAPNQGPYLKTPSYDLTEEQLMANIEKEFECTI